MRSAFDDPEPTSPNPQPTADIPSDLWQTPAEAVAALANLGQPIPTGFEPVDRQLRGGGLPPGHIIVIGGPPEAGKTTIAVEMALAMSAHIPCFGLFSDEGRAQAAARVGVMSGVPMKQIDEDAAAAGAEMADRLAERSLTLLKPDTQWSYAENIVKHAAATLGPGQPAAIFLDSVQTIQVRRPDDGDDPLSPRLAAKALVTACRAWGDTYGFIFVLTSQASRAFYRFKKDDDNINAIAAFSESGAIEFMADVALVLSRPDETTKVVRAKFVKNRLKGTANGFALKYDVERGRMAEVDAVAVEQADQQADRERLRAVEAAVLDELKKAEDGLSRAHITELTHKRKGDVLAALENLIHDRKAYQKKAGRAVLYFYVEGR